MPLAPETPVSPIAQAPPDRQSYNLEQLLAQVSAVIFADRVLDQNERKLLYDFMAEVSLRAANGGIGQGGTPPAEGPEAGMPQSPMEMNQNTQDLGTVEGAQPEDDEEGY